MSASKIVCRVAGVIFVVSILLGASVANALTINLTYGNGFGAGTDARKDADAAAAWWQATLLTNFNVNITVALTDGSTWGNAVGRMHSNTETAAADPGTGTKLPTAGNVELNQNLSFFFDSTPFDSSEFNMNQENGRYGAATAAAATGKWDALSVLVHEMGHALGFSRTTGNWQDTKPYTGYTDFVNNFTANTYTFDWLTYAAGPPSTGTEGNKTGANSALTTVGFDADSHIDGTGQPALNRKVMANPGFGTGTRSLATPLDVDIIGDAFHLAINDKAVPVPEPATWIMLAIGLPAARLYRRRRNTA